MKNLKETQHMKDDKRAIKQALTHLSSLLQLEIDELEKEANETTSTNKWMHFHIAENRLYRIQQKLCKFQS